MAAVEAGVDTPATELAIVETLTVMLSKPYTMGKGDGAIVTDRLNLVEPTARQFVDSQRGISDSERLLLLIQAVAQVPMQVVDSISVREMRECDRFFGQFFSDIQSA